jgi:hypothetical protein
VGLVALVVLVQLLFTRTGTIAVLLTAITLAAAVL